MQNFEVDDDVAAAVWRLANPRPFENPSFSDALRKVLTMHQMQPTLLPQTREPLLADRLLAELEAMSKEDLEKLNEAVTSKRRQRAPSPSTEQWASTIPALRAIHHLRSWKDVCDHLKIVVGGDSARRKLAAWVKERHPEWPAVPDV
jgi:hypothetical protein